MAEADLPVLAETAAFDALKPRLVRLWREVFSADDQPYTSVVVPSVTMDAGDRVRTPHANFHEEVLLFLLIRLRNPHARVVFVTSQPLPTPVVDYYLQFLAGIPASHAAARLTLLSAYDGSPRPLTAKILERPRLLQRIRDAVPDRDRAYLTVLRSTPLERRLAVALDLPLNAADPEMEALCSKSGARRVFAEAGVATAAGAEGLRDEDDVVDALGALSAERPAMRRALLKLDASFWDQGHGTITVPGGGASKDALRSAVRALEAPRDEQAESYLARFARRGGVLEERVEGRERADASVQLRINPLGKVFLTSSHDELPEGPSPLQCRGCAFPADDSYRMRIQEEGMKAARALAAHGLVSRVSVEFLLTRDRPSEEWRLIAHDLNLGVGGATHPLLAVRFLTGGTLDPRTGLFVSPAGNPKFYRCTDHLSSPRWRGLLPDDLIEALTLERLTYTPRGESGALFYMLGAISELGRVGVVAIGNSRAQADSVYRRVVETLDRVTA